VSGGEGAARENRRGRGTRRARARWRPSPETASPPVSHPLEATLAPPQPAAQVGGGRGGKRGRNAPGIAAAANRRASSAVGGRHRRRRTGGRGRDGPAGTAIGGVGKGGRRKAGGRAGPSDERESERLVFGARSKPPAPPLFSPSPPSPWKASIGQTKSVIHTIREGGSMRKTIKKRMENKHRGGKRFSLSLSRSPGARARRGNSLARAAHRGTHNKRA
jgi:hypothetical protein